MLIINSPDYRVKTTTSDDTSVSRSRRDQTPRARFLYNTGADSSQSASTVSDSLFEALTPSSTRIVSTGVSSMAQKTVSSAKSAAITSYKKNEDYFTQNKASVSVLSRSVATTKSSILGGSLIASATGQNSSSSLTTLNPASLIEQGIDTALSNGQTTGTNTLLRSGAELYRKIGAMTYSSSSFFKSI